jgi:hypothetical protein
VPALAQGTPTRELWRAAEGHPRRSRGEFLDSVSSDSCHGGAQLVSDANFGKNGMGRASDEYRFISSPPHRVLHYCGGRLKLSDGRVLLCGFPPKGSNCSCFNRGGEIVLFPRTTKTIKPLPGRIKFSNFPGLVGRVGHQATEVAG